MFFDSEIRQELRQLRIQAGYSQEQLADYLALTQSTVSRIENGKQVVDAATYKNWIWVCEHPPVEFEFYYDRRREQHA